METADIDRILVDVDGTLCRNLPRVCEFIAREHGLDVSPADITDWTYRFERIDTGIDDIIARLMTDHPEWLLSELDPVAGAQAALDTLAGAGHEIRIVTHRPAHTHHITQQWLDDHDISYDHLVRDVPANKADVAGDALVDDFHGHVYDAVEAGMVGVLFERPYSRPVAGPQAVTVSTWAAVLETFGVETRPPG